MTKILTVFNLKSIHFIPQSTQISMTSHLDSVILKPEKDENMSKTFITSIKDSLSFRKNIVSSAYAAYKNV